VRGVVYARRSWVLEVKQLRLAREWNQTELAYHAGLAPSVISEIENGKRDPSARTLRKLADAFEVDVADLFPKAQAPLPFEDARQRGVKETEDQEAATEPLSPRLRRHAASMRRAELERVLQHLTLRIETLRDQAKVCQETNDVQRLWALFLDSVLLARGAEALVAESRAEAQDIGGETKEERRLRGRLEHRTEDLEEVREKLGDIWHELLDAKAGAEKAWREELHNAAELSDHDNVSNLFQRNRRAV
jgi:transcriptional regulator with XRE-family HTH domain